MPRPLPRPTFSNVMATLALFVALGGTSYAAVTIDSSNVRNGSLTGRDIRDRSIGRAELKKNALKTSVAAGETGTTGATGPRGIAGPAGPAGSTGPSDGIIVRGKQHTFISEDQIVLRFDLPAGNWLLTATGHFDNEGSRTNLGTCRLVNQNPIQILAETSGSKVGPQLGVASDTDTESFSMTGAATLPDTSRIAFVCDSNPSFLTVEKPTVTAVRVGTLSNTRVVEG